MNSMAGWFPKRSAMLMILSHQIVARVSFAASYVQHVPLIPLRTCTSTGSQIRLTMQTTKSGEPAETLQVPIDKLYGTEYLLLAHIVC